MAQSKLKLYVWNGKWDLPSIEPDCLAAILYLQLAFPGDFDIVECTNPDLSPSGNLPFLTHHQHSISPLSSILTYLSSLDPSTLQAQADSKDHLDSHLSHLEQQQSVAWHAYIEKNLGDLTAHTFFILHPNYTTLTLPTYASLLPLPQRYFVPHRLREAYKPRLESAGLWEVTVAEEFEADKKRRKEKETRDEKIRLTFQREKILEKANQTFTLLSSLPFLASSKPNTISILLASHILLLTHAPLPNPLLRDLLTSKYPTLPQHAKHILQLVKDSLPSPIKSSPLTVVDSLRLLGSGIKRIASGQNTRSGEKIKKTPEQIAAERWRLAWIGLSTIGSVVFLFGSGLLRVGYVTADEAEAPFEEVVEVEGEAEEE